MFLDKYSQWANNALDKCPNKTIQHFRVAASASNINYDSKGQLFLYSLVKKGINDDIAKKTIAIDGAGSRTKKLSSSHTIIHKNFPHKAPGGKSSIKGALWGSGTQSNINETIQYITALKNAAIKKNITIKITLVGGSRSALQNLSVAQKMNQDKTLKNIDLRMIMVAPCAGPLPLDEAGGTGNKRIPLQIPENISYLVFIDPIDGRNFLYRQKSLYRFKWNTEKTAVLPIELEGSHLSVLYEKQYTYSHNAHKVKKIVRQAIKTFEHTNQITEKKIVDLMLKITFGNAMPNHLLQTDTNNLLPMLKLYTSLKKYKTRNERRYSFFQQFDKNGKEKCELKNNVIGLIDNTLLTCHNKKDIDNLYNQCVNTLNIVKYYTRESQIVHQVFYKINKRVLNDDNLRSFQYMEQKDRGYLKNCRRS